MQGAEYFEGLKIFWGRILPDRINLEVENGVVVGCLKDGKGSHTGGLQMGTTPHALPVVCVGMWPVCDAMCVQYFPQSNCEYD